MEQTSKTMDGESITASGLYLGDAFELMKSVESKSVDLVVTDPPYLHSKGRGINHKTHKAYKNGHSAFATSELYDQSGFMMNGMNFFDNDKINTMLSEMVRVCKKPNIYVFCNETQVPIYCDFATSNGLLFSILVWEKPLSIINRNRFSQNVEFIIRIYDYGTCLNRLPQSDNNIYNRVRKVNQVSPANKLHPTQKPLELVEPLIALNTNVGDVVLDPFMGSGTTIIAACKLGRKYLGFELEEKYYNIANKRVKEYNQQLKLF